MRRSIRLSFFLSAPDFPSFFRLLSRERGDRCGITVIVVSSFESKNDCAAIHCAEDECAENIVVFVVLHLGLRVQISALRRRVEGVFKIATTVMATHIVRLQSPVPGERRTSVFSHLFIFLRPIFSFGHSAR